MKLSEVPQDKSSLENFTREVCYAKDDEGNYRTELSSGWNIKAEALDAAWEEVERLSNEARLLVANGSKSPIYYFMMVKLMDISILSAYTGFWKFSVKRHIKPSVFKSLSDKKLSRYADIFGITIDELKNFKG